MESEGKGPGWRVVDHMKTVYIGGEGEIVEKKSRFIATVRPVASEEEAVAHRGDEEKILGRQTQLFRICDRRPAGVKPLFG